MCVYTHVHARIRAYLHERVHVYVSVGTDGLVVEPIRLMCTYKCKQTLMCSYIYIYVSMYVHT